MYQGTIGAEEEGDLIDIFMKRRLEALKGDGEAGLYTRVLEEVREELYAGAMCWINLWKLANFLSMSKLANLAMYRLITEFDLKNLKEGGFNFLRLVGACYAPGTNPDTPIRIWIQALFATGMAKMRREGDRRFQEAYCMVTKKVCLVVQWYREEYEGMADEIKAAECAMEVFDDAGVLGRISLED